MYRLYFCDRAGGQLNLPDLSPGAASLVKAIRYTPGSGSSGTNFGDGVSVDDEITLQLEGLPAAIEALTGQIGRALAQAGREATIPGGQALYLVGQLTADLGLWRSKILGGVAVWGPNGAENRGAGVQQCVLKIRRADWWEGLAELVPYTVNSTGQNGGTYLSVANHSDAAHAGYMNIPVTDANFGTENIAGDLPAPLHLTVGLVDQTNTRPMTFFIGETWRRSADLLAATYQGESGSARPGVTGTITVDAGCANGNYLNLAWNGAADTELWSIDIPVTDLRTLGGGPLLPVMRLQASLSTAGTEKIWYRWKIYAMKSGTEYYVGETPSRYAEQGAQLIAGPAVDLPPYMVDQAVYNTQPVLRLVLTGAAAGAGAHALKLDFLSLLGLDGWRITRPLSTAPTKGIDDLGAGGAVYHYLEAYQSHSTEGPGFWVMPGQPHRLVILCLRHDAGDKVAPVDLFFKVYTYYRPRKRML